MPYDVNLEKTESLLSIIEYDLYDNKSGRYVRSSVVMPYDVNLEKIESLVMPSNQTKNSKKFKVSLLIDNWEGNIMLSKPVYPQKIPINSSLSITFDIQADTDLYADIDKKGYKLYAVGYYQSTDFKQKKDLINYFWSAALSDIRKDTMSVKFGSFALEDVWGSGKIYLFIISAPSNSIPEFEESFGAGNLMIQRTVSNVLELPITIEKQQ
jgi:hypothetical protein